jgi:hypothetical protein
MSRPANFNKLDPSQATSVCTREQAEQLAKYDHHRALVDGKPAGLQAVIDELKFQLRSQPR